MAFSVPTLAEVVRTVENGFSTAFYGSAGVLRVTVLKLLAKVIGAAIYIPLLCCRYIWQNSFVATADAESLCKIGQDYNLPHKPATFAHGTVNFVGTSGVKVAAGTVLMQESSGLEFETLEDVTLVSSGAVANIKALVAGSESNIGSSVVLSFRDGTPTGITMAVAGDVDGGNVDVVQVGSSSEEWGETLEEYRARLKQRKQNQPQGGCLSDFVGWCKRFDFVTDVYAFQNWPATNNVTLFLANTNVDACTVSDSDVATVRNYVQDATRKPLCCNPYVLSVKTCGVSFTCNLTEVTDVVKTAVTAAVKNFLKTFAPNDTIYFSDLLNVCKAASGDPSCTISTLVINSQVITDGYQLPRNTESSGKPVGYIVNLNTVSITWVAE